MATITVIYNILLFVIGIFFNVLPTGMQDAVAGIVTGPVCILIGTCGVANR